MSIRLYIYLILRELKYNTELDYRLTQLELYEMGADEMYIQEFRNIWDEGRLKHWKS